MNNLLKTINEVRDNLIQFYGYNSNLIFDVGDRSDLLIKVEEVAYNIIHQIAHNEVPHYSIVSNKSMKTVSLKNAMSRKKFTTVIYVLSKMFRLLNSNQISTKRELYYENVNQFDSQRDIDHALHDLCEILQVPIWQLRIVGTAKGLIAGNVIFQLENETITIDSCGSVIPQNILDIKEIRSDAKWVLLVEKDAAFQKLLQDDALSRMGPCIFVTGKGFPDVNTRIIIRRLWEELQIPILAMVDADPHGIAIMCVYRFGSMTMASHSVDLACPAVRWIGVHPTDISRLSIESQPLTSDDHKKIENLLARPYCRSNAALRHQLQALKDGGVKAEIEGLSHFAPSYIADTYIPSKIICQEFI